MDVAAVFTFVETARKAISLFKEAKTLLPDGKQKTEAIKKIEEAEKVLKLAESRAAKEMGYDLCKCEFPAQIMLFDKNQNVYRCQKCGHELPVQYNIRRGSTRHI